MTMLRGNGGTQVTFFMSPADGTLYYTDTTNSNWTRVHKMSKIWDMVDSEFRPVLKDVLLSLATGDMVVLRTRPHQDKDSVIKANFFSDVSASRLTKRRQRSFKTNFEDPDYQQFV